MTAKTATREMSSAERAWMEELLAAHPSIARKWKEGVGNALIVWAIYLLGYVIVWLIVAWFVRLVSDLEVGFKSPYAIWIVGVGTPICAILAVYSSVKWISAWGDDRLAIREDLKNAQVLEQDCRVVEIKRFQEPEHGGFLYFLRMSDERVFVLYDRESQDLWIQGQDPESSSFQPCGNLNIVQAPTTGFTISHEFSGPKIECFDTLELRISPEEWPEQESWCEIPWDKLNSKLS